MGLSEDIYQEGLRIPPVTLVRKGVVQRDVLAMLLANVRTPAEREGDLMAQVAAAAWVSGDCANYWKPTASQKSASTLMPCKPTRRD